MTDRSGHDVEKSEEKERLSENTKDCHYNSRERHPGCRGTIDVKETTIGYFYDQ